jgi:6-phosphogluconolactonase (cycloisomerase 2 family)
LPDAVIRLAKETKQFVAGRTGRQARSMKTIAPDPLLIEGFVTNAWRNKMKKPAIHLKMLARLIHGGTASGMCAVLLTAAALQPAQAHDPQNRNDKDNVVYVESNIATAQGNSILAYRRDQSGRLTPLPGSPFATRGAGIVDPSLALGPFDSDQQIITNPERTLLFAVNPGSNTIAVFRIADDGGLTHVTGSPFPSGGVMPVSIGLSRDTLVVVNKAMDPNQTGQTPNYVSFRVSPDGRLEPTPLSTKNAAVGSSPSQALVSSGKSFVFGADFLGGLMQSFVINPDGTLDQNPPQQLPANIFNGSTAKRLPLGLAAHPGRPVVYVGLVTINKIGVYQYDTAGVLSFVTSVPDSGMGPCWVRVNNDGTRLYSSNTGDNSISVFDIANPLKPVEIQHLRLKGTGSSFEIELDPENIYLYAVTQRAAATTPLGQGNNLHVLRVGVNGRLTENEGSPLALPVPSGTRPQGLATFSD